jgi:hypothetical protein
MIEVSPRHLGLMVEYYSALGTKGGDFKLRACVEEGDN